MKLLTITSTGQGQRSNDFCHADEGEIAYFSTRCDRGTVDHNCGCSRAMCGLQSRRASTTMQVRDVDITPEQVAAQLTAYYEGFGVDTAGAKERAAADTEDLTECGAMSDVGTVVEFRGDRLIVRDLEAATAGSTK